jgi:hypothetical protein
MADESSQEPQTEIMKVRRFWRSSEPNGHPGPRLRFVPTGSELFVGKGLSSIPKPGAFLGLLSNPDSHEKRAAATRLSWLST